MSEVAYTLPEVIPVRNRRWADASQVVRGAKGRILGTIVRTEIGAKRIAAHGYVRIYVGIGHHLAVKGWAYEHRVVAEAMIGRRLLTGEAVHHKDHNRQNNDPCNLVIAASVAEHLVEHRKPGSKLRLPGEPNPTIVCGCGCGASLKKFDEYGRPRRSKSGHSMAKRPTCERPTCAEVVRVLKNGELHRKDIAKATGRTVFGVMVALSRLKNEGVVEIASRGVWKLKSVPEWAKGGAR